MKKKKSSLWPVGIFSFYSLFVLALLAFIGFSRFHKMDLVTKNYYEEELKYQEHIDRQARAGALSQALAFQYDKAWKKISLTFPPEIDPATISGTVFFFRPSDARQDLKIPIAVSQNGRQTIDVGTLAKGYWRVKIFWNVDDVEYYNEEILIIE